MTTVCLTTVFCGQIFEPFYCKILYIKNIEQLKYILYCICFIPRCRHIVSDPDPKCNLTKISFTPNGYVN